MQEQDKDTIISKLKKELQRYENERSMLYAEHHRRKHALDQIRRGFEEAVSLTGRWKDMGTLPPDQFQTIFNNRANDMVKLHAYFRECLRRYDDVISGFPIEGEAERPELDADSSDDADQKE